jgi:N-acetylglutamate synthase-like GNAT family acetyltransferase
MSISIRPARAADQAAIKAIVYAARLNPRDLNWQRFLVAEEDGQVVGVGQVKPHGDGSRELASLAVIPERQAQGIGGMLVSALLAREPGQVHLMCMDWLERYYQRFEFRRLGRADLPPSFRTIARLAPALALVSSLLGKRMQLIVMRRDGDRGWGMDRRIAP